MATADRSISSVLNDVAGNIQDIVRSEMRLAKTEITEEAVKAGSAGIWLAAAALMLAFGMLFALLAAFFALTAVMPPWAAALIVAAGEGALGAMALAIGIKLFRAVRAAPKTVATLQENVEWARHPTR